MHVFIELKSRLGPARSEKFDFRPAEDPFSAPLADLTMMQTCCRLLILSVVPI